MRNSVNLRSIFAKWQLPSVSTAKVAAYLKEEKLYKPVLILLLISLFAFQITGIFYKSVGIIMLSEKEERVREDEVPAPIMVARESFDAYKQIVERNLFGSTDKTLADKQAKVAEAPPLSSLLELRGTVAGDDKFGFAIIEEKAKNKQFLVKIGNAVAGATLLRVMRDQVVMNYQDKEETLKRTGSMEAPVISPARGAASASTAAAATGGDTIKISRSEIMQSMRDMGQMLSQAQIRPYFVAGVPDGFMVSNIREGSIFKRMGLSEGDIIQGLNQKKMQGADDMLELYNSLRAASTMSLSIKRGGRQETINYNFN